MNRLDSQRTVDNSENLIATNKKQKKSLQLHNDWNGAPYKGDQLPTHHTESQKLESAKRYKNIPEEFYTKSKLKVVTPENYQSWFAAHKDLKITWILQEQFSGSGRVSITAFHKGLSVLFPVDLRYGWDPTLQAHRKTLSHCQEHCKPLVRSAAPDCRHWTATSNAHPNEDVLKKSRQDEFPMLDWLQQDNHLQASMEHGYINENGLRSQIWSRSPLKNNDRFVRNKPQRADGCAHGMENKEGSPLQKAYRLDSNIRLNKTAKRCPGHGLLEHGHIEGGETARTTVYTKNHGFMPDASVQTSACWCTASMKKAMLYAQCS